MGSSDTFDFCDGPQPFPPGESPFHIKGEFYRATVIDHTQRKEQGDDIVASLTPELQAFLRQPFLSSLWYDVLPYPLISMAEARYFKKDVRTFCYEMARESALRALNGVCRVLFLLMSTRSIASRGIGATGLFYDFGPVEQRPSTDKNSVAVVRHEVPLVLIELWCIVTKAYVEVLLENSGAKGVRCEYHYGPTGTLKGAPIGDAHSTIRWQ